MNYRHAFHAGNFADVIKHVVLVRILMHLREKETAFRVIETHAGAGHYDLSDVPASRTGEWRDGIGRLMADPPSGEPGELIEPYLTQVRAANSGFELRIYPGSPALVLALTRPQDRMIFCELQPDERKALAAAIVRDRRARISETDGWIALKAHLPPSERRGLVLIDPPFEDPDEFHRFEEGLAEAHRRWATGIYQFWYPIKDMRETEAFARRVARLGIAKILRIELTVAPVQPEEALSACGLLVINPPWTLEADLSRLMPACARLLGRNSSGRHRIDWLAR